MPSPPRRVVVEPKPRWIELAALIVAALVINGVTIWLNETAEPKFSRDVGAMVALAGAVLLWSGLWALISRIFAGASRFPRHLGIAAGAFLVYTIYTIFAEATAFSLSSARSSAMSKPGFGSCSASPVSFICKPSRRPTPWLKAGIVALLVIAGIAVQVTNHLEQLKNGAAAEHRRTNFPPAFRLARAESEDQFFTAVDALREKLEADRKAGASAP